MEEVLQPAGYQCITHERHFAGRFDVVSDTEIITACGNNGWFLITSDKDLHITWIEQVRAAGIGIFLLSNQNDGSDVWAQRVIACETSIVKEALGQPRPFVARISCGGKLYILDEMDADSFKWKRVYSRPHQ